MDWPYVVIRQVSIRGRINEIIGWGLDNFGELGEYWNINYIGEERWKFEFHHEKDATAFALKWG